MSKTIITNDDQWELSTALYAIDSEAELVTDYSGRGMYGGECIGIIAKDTDAILLSLSRRLPDHLADKIENAEVAHDSMGLREIVYWPSLAVEDEPVQASNNYMLVHTGIEVAFDLDETILVDAEVVEHETGSDEITEEMLQKHGTPLRDMINPETFSDLVKLVQTFLPEADIQDDLEGQIVIYTNRTLNEDDEIEVIG